MKKKIIVLIVSLATVLSLCACGNMLKSAHPIKDVNNLDGQRIGVIVGWGPDYLFTGRRDITLMRYDAVADMVTALAYKRIDAIALDKPMVPTVLERVSGLRMIDEPVYTDGLVAYISKDREDVLEKFNEFIPVFQATDKYEELLCRFSANEPYVENYVEMTGTGDILRVGVTEDNYPFVYEDPETGRMLGSDMELITHFANYYNYKIELYRGAYESVEMGVAGGLYDIGIGSLSDLYRADLGATGRALVSDIYMPMDIVFVEVSDPEALKILATIDY